MMFNNLEQQGFCLGTCKGTAL